MTNTRVGWLRIVDSLKLYVSVAEYRLFYMALLRKRAIVLRRLRIVGTPSCALCERWGAGVETQKNVRGEIGGWGRVPFNEPYAPLLSTIYDGA